MSNNSKISILLPTRGRTEQLNRSISSLIDTATDPSIIQWLIGFDNDDTDTYKWFEENVLPKIKKSGAKYTFISFEPLGYTKLNIYVNSLAAKATGDWFIFWNDDAVMKTAGWDQEIISHTGEFCLQAFETHNRHPYSIFPVVPKKWHELIGHLSRHQLNDAWLSQIAWMLDIMKRIPINVDHERFDLSGKNKDATFNARQIFEGNPSDPRDFNHIEFRKQRITEANTIANYLLTQGYELEHWKLAIENKTDVWAKMMAADVNNQMTKYPT